jgi:hypothetical protein
MSAESKIELQRLLSALCDGQLTELARVRLEELLAGDVEARRQYLEYVDLHARLLVHPDLGGATTRPEEAIVRNSSHHETQVTFAEAPVASGKTERQRRVRHALRYGLVAASTLAASLLVQALWRPVPATDADRDATPVPRASEVKAPGAVATLTQTADCVWENPSEPWGVGSRLLPGEISLAKGVARIRFDSGPELVVEGPADLYLESATAATLLRGKLVFRADETAPTFSLHTPSATLVDLGTEYAVATGPDGEEIHVFDGEVQRTPKNVKGEVEAEQLKAGEARRYGVSATSPGQPTTLAPARFIRRLTEPMPPAPDAGACLLAYEGFDYTDAELFRSGKASGGRGWSGPWTPGFIRPLNPGDESLPVFNAGQSLMRSGAAAASMGGCFDYTGFTKFYRRLATPVRLDRDGVYFLSFLFRRYGPPADPINAVAVLFWTNDDFQQQLEDRRKRLNIGIGDTNQLFTHLQGVGSRTPLPLSYGETYLLVAKIVAGKSNPDQVFMRVYGPDEPIERAESGSWSVVGPLFQSDLVFDWLQLHVNSKTRQMIDEIRLGTTWSSVTAPWIGNAAPGAARP